MRKGFVILSSGVAFLIFLFVVIYQEVLNWINRQKALDIERETW